ncbi:GatB/YqeY domain-containing protein [Arenibacter sp. F26102]|uniref:GatB/YqeY domain-containing protein n=1 Tax=Arenibacter sp. F26102 TaxID=2926416 RepID=UPI001FF27CEA|nr:GatB/YqeY domain-containing protein [Arenibacter sp. F26102]MCK0147654.1 GatB/YqeY domain-containing protein [Arenibacter sp. F26102]
MQRLVKQLKDSAAIFADQCLDDLIEPELAQIVVSNLLVIHRSRQKLFGIRPKLLF